MGVAVDRGRLAAAKLLIDEGNADVNLHREFGRTFLQVAAASLENEKGPSSERKMVQMATLLLEHDADPFMNTLGEHHLPIEIAAVHGFIPIFKFLLETTGANINEKRFKGFTFLHLAKLGGKFNMVSLLLELKADPLIIDERDNIPLDAYDGKTISLETETVSMAKCEKILNAALPAGFPDKKRRLAMKSAASNAMLEKRAEERKQYCFFDVDTNIEADIAVHAANPQNSAIVIPGEDPMADALRAKEAQRQKSTAKCRTGAPPQSFTGCGFQSPNGTCTKEKCGKDGSIRCTKHTCKQPGCGKEKPSKEQFCDVHRASAVSAIPSAAAAAAAAVAAAAKKKLEADKAAAAAAATAKKQQEANKAIIDVPISSIVGFPMSEIGKRCTVALPPQQSGRTAVGTLKWVGMHPVRGTPRVGVVFDSPVGFNDGTLSVVNYNSVSEKEDHLGNHLHVCSRAWGPPAPQFRRVRIRPQQTRVHRVR